MENDRRDERMSVIWTAEIHTDEDVYSCCIDDVSTGGTRVRTDAKISVGDVVELVVTHLGSFAAEVRWLEDGMAGLFIHGGPDILLKKYADLSGAYPSIEPAKDAKDDPLDASLRIDPKIRSL